MTTPTVTESWADTRHGYLTGEGELWWDKADTTELIGEPLTPAPHR